MVAFSILVVGCGTNKKDTSKKEETKKIDETKEDNEKKNLVITLVGKAEGVVYIFDLARTPIAFVGSQSVDVTAKVKAQLGVK